MDAFFSTSLLVATAGSNHITQTSSKVFSIAFVLIGIPSVLFCLGYIIEEILKQRISDIEDKVNEIIVKEDKILAEEKEILKNKSF
jgi:hypothetical protein